MPEKPIFDPNKPYQTNVDKPKFDPNKPFEVKDSISQNSGLEAYQEPVDKVESTLNFIQENSLRVMKDHEKDILRDMINNPNTKKEDLSDAIVTLQGKKAKQIGNLWTTPDYYLDTDKNGVTKPIALTEGEKIPAHKDVANIWGSTRQSSKEDSWYTDVAKTAFNIIPNVIEGVVDLGQLGSQLITGDESETLRSAQNSLEGMKFKLDEDIQKPMYNTEGIKEFTDIFDRGRVDLSPETIWGTALSALGFIGEMAVPGGLISKGAKAYKAGRLGIEGVVELSNLAKKSSVFAGSLLTNLGEVQDSSSEAGLTGRAKGVYDMIISSLLSLIDAKYDVGGKILSNMDTQVAKKGILDELGKKVVKDAEGNITKESLEQVTKEAIQAYTPIVSSFAKQYGKDVLDETKDEVIQEFIDKAGQNVWDKLSPEEQGKFGTDAFSAKSFGDYINAALSSVAGAGVPSVISAKQEQRKAYLEQSNSAYEAVRSGEKATKDLKTNLEKSFERGDISKDDYDHALLKVNAYEGYNKTAKNLILNDEDKKKMMELAFQKENLEASIKEVEAKDKKGHSRLDELNSLELGVHNSKRDQAKALQKEIDAIVTKSEVIAQPEVSKKVVENVKKEEEVVNKEEKSDIKETDKNNSELRKKKAEEKFASLEEHPSELKPKKAYIEDKRNYEEIPDSEFNNHFTDARLIHKVLRKHLDKLPSKEMLGRIVKHEFKYNKNGKPRINRTLKVALEDGRVIKLASSMIREDSLLSGHAKTENFIDTNNAIGYEVPNTLVGVKEVNLGEIPENYPYKDQLPEDYKSNKKAIKVYNKKTGKFISWVKETNTGRADAKDKNGNALYNENEIDLLKHAETINETPQDIDESSVPFEPVKPVNVRAKEATEKIVKEGKEKVASEKASVPLTITKQVRQQLYDLGYSRASVDMMKPERANKIINEQITNKNAEESTINGEKSKSRSNEETNGESESTSKELELKKPKGNKNREDRGVKSPLRKKASEIDPANAYEAVLSHFIGKGFVSMDSLRKFFKETRNYNIKDWVKTNSFKRQNITKKGAPTIDELANYLWENQSDRLANLTTEDYKDAIEEVLRVHTSPIEMAKELLENNGIGVDLTRLEEITLGAELESDKQGYSDEFNDVVDYLEGKTDEELKALADKDKWEEGTDIVINQEDEPFQKAKDKTVDLFKKSMELFYDAKEAEGASKKRGLAEKRRKLMEENPTVKYIDDNIKYIYKQLENKGLLTKKGNCP